jgi:hypothetical protein
MKINMMNICLTSLLFIASTNIAMADGFCDGFEHGYITGYKQGSGSSIDPITPICPIEPIKGLNDPDSDFEFGYTIGYQQVLRAG